METASLLAEVGSTGLNQQSGYIHEEYHRDLRGPQGMKVYRQMMDHPIINALFLLTDLLAVNARKWVEASGDTPQHLAAKDLVESALEDVEGGLNGVLLDALTCGPYGWSALEKVFKPRLGKSAFPEYSSKFNDGMIGWRLFGYRSQDSLERWDFDDNGRMRGFWQLPAPDYRRRYLPRSKFLHFTMRSPKGNPEGRPMLRPIYDPYYFERHTRFIEGVGIERNLAGLPVMEVPAALLNPNATAAEKQALASFKEMVRKLKVDEYGGVVIPSEETPDGKKTGYRLRLMNTAGKSNAETDPVIRRHRSELAMGLFGEFIIVGQDKVGSFALHSDKTAMFAMGVGARIDGVLGPLNEDAVPELCELNGLPAEVAPKICRGDIATPSLQDLAAYVSALSGGGFIVPDAELEKHLREVGGLPAPEERTIVSVPTQVAAPAPTNAAVAPQPVDVAGGGQ